MLEGLGVRDQFLRLTLRKPLSVAFLLSAVLGVERSAAGWVQQLINHRYALGCIQYVHGRAVVLLSNLHSRVPRGCGRTADDQRNLELLPFHFARDMDHLIQGRCNQTA